MASLSTAAVVWQQQQQPQLLLLSSSSSHPPVPLYLLLGIDGDGLSLGVIEAVHGLDVQHPGHSQGHNGQQQDGDKESAPDSRTGEAHAVPGLGEGHLVRLSAGPVHVQLQLQPCEGQCVGGGVGRHVCDLGGAREGEAVVGSDLCATGEVHVVVCDGIHPPTSAVVDHVQGDLVGGRGDDQLGGGGRVVAEGRHESDQSQVGACSVDSVGHLQQADHVEVATGLPGLNSRLGGDLAGYSAVCLVVLDSSVHVHDSLLAQTSNNAGDLSVMSGQTIVLSGMGGSIAEVHEHGLSGLHRELLVGVDGLYGSGPDARAQESDGRLDAWAVELAGLLAQEGEARLTLPLAVVEVVTVQLEWGGGVG